MHPLSVLIADDDPLICRYLKSTLIHMGHRAEVVMHGAAAVGMMRARPYDVVLMDYHMPTVDGITATQIIRSEPLTRQPRIVAISGETSAIYRRACLAAGVDGFITKPLMRHDLELMFERLYPSAAPATAPML